MTDIAEQGGPGPEDGAVQGTPVSDPRLDPEDAARELDKAGDVLGDVLRHLNAVAESNAALHLAATVRPSPLAVRVETALEETRRSAARFREEKP